MGKQSRLKKLRRANSGCIFCEQPGVTKEHIWSQWMHPILGVRREDEATEFYQINASKTDRAGTREVRNRQGSTATKTVRVVCGNCNHGWMKDLEKKARPFLEPLLLGDPITLLPAGRELVAQWITMKLLVGEHAQQGIAVVPQADRTCFMQQRRIPDSVKIWIGQIDSHKWKHGWQRHAATLTWPNEAPPRPFHKNVQTTTFGVGRLFVFAMICYLTDYQGGPNEAEASRLPQLWPLSDQAWPPERRMTEQQADQLATYFDRVVRQPNVDWRPLPSDSP